MNDTPMADLPPDVAALLSAERAADAAALAGDSQASAAGHAVAPEVQARVLERVRSTVSVSGVPAEAATAVSIQSAGLAAVALGLTFVVGALVNPGEGPATEQTVPGVALVESEATPVAKGARLAATPMKIARPTTTASSTLVAPVPAVSEAVAQARAVSQGGARPGGGEAISDPEGKPKRAEAAAQKPKLEGRLEPDGVAKSTKKPRPSRRSAATLADERAILDRARAALRARDRAGALAAVRSHAKRFARGALVEERESLWVRVLLEGSKVEAGKKRAERFLRRYPRSIHRGAVERAVERAGR